MKPRRNAKILGTVGLAVWLSACATQSAPDRRLGPVDLSRGVTGVSRQPQWWLEINRKRIELIVMHRGVFRAERPKLTLSADRAVYEAVTDAGQAVRVTLTLEPCTTEHQGGNYPLEALIEADGQIYEGCAEEFWERIIVAGSATLQDETPSVAGRVWGRTIGPASVISGS